MYSLRLWSVKHSRAMERTYDLVNPAIVGLLRAVTRVFGTRLDKPITFDAIDERPVDLIFVLLAPLSAGAAHLKALARVSRLLRDRAACEKLRGATSADALYAVLTEPLHSHAA